MRPTTKYLLILLMATIFGSFSLNAMAGGYGECDHPRFMEHGCGYEGQDGKDGRDGKDGVDGESVVGPRGPQGPAGESIVGPQGPAGPAGKDGRDGIDGKDGTVDSEWYSEINSALTTNERLVQDYYDEQNHAMAANAAVQIHLPQEKSFRMTLGTARVNGKSGLGVGFAMKADDDVALTLGVGKSGSETAVTGAVSFEF